MAAQNIDNLPDEESQYDESVIFGNNERIDNIGESVPDNQKPSAFSDRDEESFILPRAESIDVRDVEDKPVENAPLAISEIVPREEEK